MLSLRRLIERVHSEMKLIAFAGRLPFLPCPTKCVMAVFARCWDCLTEEERCKARGPSTDSAEIPTHVDGFEAVPHHESAGPRLTTPRVR